MLDSYIDMCARRLKAQWISIGVCYPKLALGPYDPLEHVRVESEFLLLGGSPTNIMKMVVSRLHAVHIHGKCVRHRKWLADAGGFDDKIVKITLLAETLDGFEQVTPQRAADATVVHLHHFGILLDYLGGPDLARV